MNGLLNKYFWYSAKARYYNPQVSVWLAVDPILKPNESPYMSFANNPIMIVDHDGRDTCFADNKARKIFKAALEIVNRKVDEYQQMVNDNQDPTSKRGLKKLEKDKQKLEEWSKLKSDFDKITSKETENVYYSTGDLKGGQKGVTTRDEDGNLIVKLGSDLSTVIHENRHVSQLYEGTIGSSHNTDWFDELEAWHYQKIFDPAPVDKFITETGKSVHGSNWPSHSMNFTLEDAIEYAYPNIPKKTFDNLR